MQCYLCYFISLHRPRISFPTWISHNHSALSTLTSNEQKQLFYGILTHLMEDDISIPLDTLVKRYSEGTSGFWWAHKPVDQKWKYPKWIFCCFIFGLYRQHEQNSTFFLMLVHLTADLIQYPSAWDHSFSWLENRMCLMSDLPSTGDNILHISWTHTCGKLNLTGCFHLSF